MDGQEFLSADAEKRLESITDFLLTTKDDQEKKEQNGQIDDFLNSLELILTEADKKEIQTIIDCRKFLKEPSAAPRLILEHLALTLPRLSR